jgi:hypothetical protein
MAFLYPLFLLGGLAVAVPIVLHLLRRDVDTDVPFTAVHLLRPVPVERARQRRLRDLLLLAARVVALLLLAAAFARPYRAAGGAGASLLIVAVDRSYSMGAAGMMEQARERAIEAIDRHAGPVAVLAFDDRPEVLALPGTAAAARTALAQLTPGFGSTRYRPVFERAAEVAAGAPATLVLVTDMQQSGWEGEARAVLPSSVALETAPIDGPASNAAVTALRVDRGRVVARVSASGRPFKGRLAVTAGDAAVGTADVAVEAGGSTEIEVARAPSRGTIAAAIEDPGGLPADDRRVADAQPAPPMRVLVVAAAHPGREPAFFLTRALEAGGGAETPLQVEVRPAAGVDALDEAQWTNLSAVALLSTRGMGRAARTRLGEFLQRGGGLFVAAGPDLDIDILAAVPGLEMLGGARLGAEAPTALAVTDLRHPIFAPFEGVAADLGEVRFSRAWVMPPAGWTVAAAFTDGSPAVLERPVGAGRVVVLASDVDRAWNDFPLHPGFVPFVTEAVRYLAGGRAERRAVTVAEVPSGVPATPGVHRLPGGHRLVVNVDPGEGRLARVDEQAFRKRVETIPADPARAAERQARQVEAGQSYWKYGLILMLAALAGESLVGRV